MILTQLLQSLILIICDMLMKNSSLYVVPLRLHRISRFYEYALLLGCLDFILRENLHWQFIKSPRTVNWFVDFFSTISKGLEEFSFSMLFWDCGLWGAFCGLRYLTIAVYLNVHYEGYIGLGKKLWNSICGLLWKGRITPDADRSDRDEAV